MPKRFSIRTALTIIAIAAIAYACGPWTYRRVKYIEHYPALIEWASDVKRMPNHAEGYTFQGRDGQWFSVSTCKHEVADDFSTMTYSGATPDPSRFFVVPPGKWVETIDEVLATWDRYD